MAAGVIRFGIEFIRINERLLGPFTLAQLIAMLLVLAGSLILWRSPRAKPA